MTNELNQAEQQGKGRDREDQNQVHDVSRSGAGIQAIPQRETGQNDQHRQIRDLSSGYLFPVFRRLHNSVLQFQEIGVILEYG